MRDVSSFHLSLLCERAAGLCQFLVHTDANENGDAAWGSHSPIGGKLCDGLVVCHDRTTTSATKWTFIDCRNELNFEGVWKCAKKLNKTIKEIIQGTRFSFKELRFLPNKNTSCRLQNLVNETLNCQRLPSQSYLFNTTVWIRLLWKLNHGLIAVIKTYFVHSTILSLIRMRQMGIVNLLPHIMLSI